MGGVLVLGIGNLLWADEGFGVRCVEALDAGWQIPAGVQVLDGGTQGLYLLPHLSEASKLIVFDAIDYGLEPGTMKVVVGDEVPCFMGAKKMSLHQTGFQEVIAAARLTDQCPDELVLIGVQPVELDDFGGSLRDVVRDCIPAALDIAIEWLVRWGYAPTARIVPAQTESDMNEACLRMRAYEGGRPSESEACRRGDIRFLMDGDTALEGR